MRGMLWRTYKSASCEQEPAIRMQQDLSRQRGKCQVNGKTRFTLRFQQALPARLNDAGVIKALVRKLQRVTQSTTTSAGAAGVALA